VRSSPLWLLPGFVTAFVALLGWPGRVAASPLAQAYVSASARSSAVPGDGTKGHPFATVSAGLASGARTVFIAGGRYPERVTLAAGQTLVGQAGARIEGPADGPVLTADGGTVRGLSLTSAAPLGVRISGPVRFEAVRLDLRGKAGIAIERGALRWDGGQLSGAAASRTALSLSPGAQAQLSQVELTGPFQEGIVAEGADLSLTDVRVRGCALGVRVRGGRARLSGLRIEGGGGIGLFVGPGTLRAESLVVSGHEYGVLVGQGAEVTLRAVTLSKNRRAGLAAQGGKLKVEGGVISDSGAFGGIQLSHATTELDGLRVLRSQGEGITVIGGEAHLHTVTVDQVTDPAGAEGEGILVRLGHARLENVSVSHVAGLGLYAAQAATVEFDRLRLTACEAGSVAAEAGSSVSGNVLRLRGAAAQLIATRKGSLKFGVVRRAPPGPLEIHCEPDAPIHIGTLTGAAASGDACLTTAAR
jgi:hypothetical protein